MIVLQNRCGPDISVERLFCSIGMDYVYVWIVYTSLPGVVHVCHMTAVCYSHSRHPNMPTHNQTQIFSLMLTPWFQSDLRREHCLPFVKLAERCEFLIIMISSRIARGGCFSQQLELFLGLYSYHDWKYKMLYFVTNYHKLRRWFYHEKRPGSLVVVFKASGCSS